MYTDLHKSLQQAITQAQEMAARRKRARKEVGTCPSCGEELQLQLVRWSRNPAEWKCRECGHEWTHTLTNQISNES